MIKNGQELRASPEKTKNKMKSARTVSCQGDSTTVVVNSSPIGKCTIIGFCTVVKDSLKFICLSKDLILTKITTGIL